MIAKVTTEPDDWGFDFDFKLLLDTVLMWYSSKSPLPPSKDDMLDHDPVWLSNVRKMRELLQYQLDKLPPPKTD